MRIYLKVKEDIAGALRATTSIFLRSEDGNIIGIIEAIIDTGCPETIISSEDRKRIRASQITVNSLKGKNGEIIIAGERINTRRIDNMFIRIGKFDIEMPVYISLKSIDIIKDEGPNYPIPSVIGMDFLLETGFTLVFNPSKKIAYFEK
jgi:hypothetical protein